MGQVLDKFKPINGTKLVYTRRTLAVHAHAFFGLLKRHRFRRVKARGPVSLPEDGVGEDGDASGTPGAGVPKIVSNTLSTTPSARPGAGASGTSAIGSFATAAALRDAAIVASTIDGGALTAAGGVGASGVAMGWGTADRNGTGGAVDFGAIDFGAVDRNGTGGAVGGGAIGGGAVDDVAVDVRFAIGCLPAFFAAELVTAAVIGAIAAVRAASARLRMIAFVF